jgi:hypothetical protein
MIRDTSPNDSSRFHCFLSLTGIKEEEFVRSLGVRSLEGITLWDALKTVNDKRIPFVLEGEEKSFKAEIVALNRFENGFLFMVILVNQIISEREPEEPYILDIRAEVSSSTEDEIILDVIRTLREKLLSGEICGSSQISFTKSGVSVSDFFPEFEV